MLSLYIHIPFCRSRCTYCDFYSTTREEEMERYVQALSLEIKQRRDEKPHARVHTIYLGGGTPSLLPPNLLHFILDCIYANYDVEANAEVTIEMNPDDLDPAPPIRKGGTYALISSLQAEGLPSLIGKDVGGVVNRVSLGIQTFNDELLRLIRRRHDSTSAIRAVKTLKAAGISNISIDLIYGLPGQTLAQWELDLKTAFSLGIQHLSAYALSYEQGTVLTRWLNEGRIHEVPEELSVKMYESLCHYAREAGFEHYEISNFALPGFRSRHNSSYWVGIPYQGFGPGAHSYDGKRTRRANPPSLENYLSSWEDNNSHKTFNSHKPYETYEILSDSEFYNETVMCGLRTSEGIDLERIIRRFGRQRFEELMHLATPHLNAGRLVCNSHFLHLSEKAIMTSDDIMSDLID